MEPLRGTLGFGQFDRLFLGTTGFRRAKARVHISLGQRPRNQEKDA
jgi:hypothetical protein